MTPPLYLSPPKHPFIKNAKPVSILRDLITEAMDIKAKRHQEQQRELEEEEENSVSPGLLATSCQLVIATDGILAKLKALVFYLHDTSEMPRSLFGGRGGRSVRGVAQMLTVFHFLCVTPVGLRVFVLWVNPLADNRMWHIYPLICVEYYA